MFRFSFRDRIALRGVRYLTPVHPGRATGIVAAVYEQMAREFAVVPPLTIHSVVPEILAALWALTREAYIVGAEGRSRRETLATAVSRANACPFCVEVHATMARAAGHQELAASLLNATAHAVEPTDPLIAWGLTTRNRRLLASCPYPGSATEIPHMFGTVVLFHYLNRMVNVFLEPSAVPWLLRGLRTGISRLVASTLGHRMVSVDPVPGDAVGLNDTSPPLPAEFAWAAVHWPIGAALAKLTQAVDDAAEAVLPDAVRESLGQFLGRWEGEDPGIAGSWVAAVTASFADPRERAAATLVLLTALASYRVDEGVVRAFRSFFPHDQDILAAAAWGAFAAARVAQWLSEAATR